MLNLPITPRREFGARNGVEVSVFSPMVNELVHHADGYVSVHLLYFQK